MTRSSDQYELLAECLAKHYKALLRVARPFAGGAIEAEDIVQQAAMISLAHCHKLTDEKAMKRWLFRVVKDVGLKASTKRARRKKLRTERDLPSPGLVDSFPVSSEREELVAGVLRAAESLSTDQRKVVHCVLHGLSHHETAAKLDKSPGAIRVLWHRAVQNLRKRFRPSGDGP